MDFKEKAINYIKHNNINVENKAIYEFGVFTGDSLKFLINTWHNNKLCNLSAAYGFDSFIGLPFDNLDIDKHNDWKEGFCNSLQYLHVNTINEAIKKVYEKIQFNKLKLFAGFYKNSLNTINPSDLITAAYINIDCDLYSSAYQALDFMFKNKLVSENCLIGYDDWGGTITNEVKEFAAGESLAHKEICEKYNIKCEEIYRTGYLPHVQTLWLIQNYN